MIEKKKDSSKKDSWEPNPDITMEFKKSDDWTPNKKVVHNVKRNIDDGDGEKNR